MTQNHFTSQWSLLGEMSALGRVLQCKWDHCNRFARKIMEIKSEQTEADNDWECIFRFIFSKIKVSRYLNLLSLSVAPGKYVTGLFRRERVRNAERCYRFASISFPYSSMRADVKWYLLNYHWIQQTFLYQILYLTPCSRDSPVGKLFPHVAIAMQHTIDV